MAVFCQVAPAGRVSVKFLQRASDDTQDDVSRDDEQKDGKTQARWRQDQDDWEQGE
jgi:hypothetical protein